MVEGNLFEGIYYDKDGHRKNVGFLKAYKKNGIWHISADIRGLYDMQDWIDVNYIVHTEVKTYSFQLGKMEIVNGVGREEFVLSPGLFLSDYGFEKADAVTFGDWKSSNVLASWGDSSNLQLEKAELPMEQEKVPVLTPKEAIKQESKEPETIIEKRVVAAAEVKSDTPLIEKLEDENELDIFADDEYEHFLEVTPDELKEFTALGNNVANNSFILHAFYKYHHILVARPTDPKKENLVFVGAPGVYCNRERYLASLFGFRNFKKSHRSDYTNPNFGYWYAEMYI